MKKYFDYHDKESFIVERESLHRAIRTMLVEENLPECQRAYLQLIEDLHISLESIYMLFNCMKEMKMFIKKEELDEMENMVRENEQTLEVWEQHFLSNSVCSGESCF